MKKINLIISLTIVTFIGNLNAQTGWTILNNGNVHNDPLQNYLGLGTATPNAKLDISLEDLFPGDAGLRITAPFAFSQPGTSINHLFHIRRLALKGSYSTRMNVHTNGSIGFGVENNGTGAEGTFMQIRRPNDPNKTQKFIQLEDVANNRIFFAGNLLNDGYNYSTTEGDFGMFWSDGLNNTNTNAGFVIGPHKGTHSMRIAYDGKVIVGNTSTPNSDAVLTISGKTVIGNGNIGATNLDASSAGYGLYVEEGILAERVKVAIASSTDWFDHVFEDNYSLKTLDEVEKYVKENKHLPQIPSAKEVVKEGIDLGEMNALLLLKIEELTLYTIKQQKEIEIIKSQISAK